MVRLGGARASLKALKGNNGAQLKKIHKEVMELSNRGASVHADRTGHDGRDLLEPSGDADGLCILKSPRHQRASGAHAQNQPGSSKSTATKLAAPRRLIMSPAAPKYERFGIVLLCNLHFCGQSAELQVCKNLQPSRSQTWVPSTRVP